jgi:transcriptional regulator with XRE-family HTH domain
LIRLTKVRREQELNKTRLGQLASVHPAQIGQIESGRVVPYAPTLARIAQALGWTEDPQELLKEVDDETGR